MTAPARITKADMDRVFRSLKLAGIENARIVFRLEKAEIEIMLNEEWNDAVNIPFRNAKDAIEYLAKAYDPYAS